MRTSHLLASCAAVTLLGLQVLVSRAEVPANPACKPAIQRKDAFFGIHFDLHPRKNDTKLGRDVTEENIRGFLDRVRPEYIQYDCVGHPGYAGYPTKIGYSSPGIVKDSLAVWRKVTCEKGISLVAHYCSLYATAVLDHHPDWAAIDAKGRPVPNTTSFFSPYDEQLMIPQLKEAATLYQLDGAWVDGDSWVAQLDYSPPALAEWKRQTGRDVAPKSKADPYWREWKTFHRREFEKHVARYVDALHAFNPQFQVCCNEMYTLNGLWPVGTNVDFLSADVSPENALDQTRAFAQYMANNNKPWDLISWGFKRGRKKTPAELEQEAAAILMQGGGFGIYYMPTRAGHITDDITTIATALAKFCRARQNVCFRSSTVPQVALLQSAETYWDRADTLYHRGTTDELEGALHALLELHYSVDVMAEYQLLPRLSEFPVVVIPDAYLLTDDFKRSLLDYVDAGGSLVLLGEKCAKLFEATAVDPAAASASAKPHSGKDSAGMPSTAFMSRGKGHIAAVYGPVAESYLRKPQIAIRDLIGTVMQEAFPRPAVMTDAPPTVDVALRHTSDGRLCLHMLNRADVTGKESAEKAGPFHVRIAVPQRPSAVRCEPGDTSIEWSWRDGQLEVTAPAFEIHQAIVVLAEKDGTKVAP